MDNTLEDNTLKTKCPICGSKHFVLLHSSSAAEDPYAVAAEVAPDTPIESNFCLSCGVIFNVPRFLGGLAANVYLKNVATHPHGAIIYQQIFKPSQRSRWLINRVLRCIGTVCKNPLKERMERDFLILENLLRQAGEEMIRPPDVLTVGCPLMAFMSLSFSKRFRSRLSYFINFDENYWGKACVMNGKDCLQCANEFVGALRVESWEELQDRQYQFVYIAEALDHTYDLTGFMRRLGRHLASDGLLCIRNHTFVERKERITRFPAQHSVSFTERSWQNLLRLAGYKQVAIVFDDHDFDFYALLRVGEPSENTEEPPPGEYESIRARVRPIQGKPARET